MQQFEVEEEEPGHTADCIEEVLACHGCTARYIIRKGM
jgi:hypothetical protein